MLNPSDAGQKGAITATLSQVAYVNGGEVVSPTVDGIVLTDGTWSFDPAASNGLYSNSDLTPANTYYTFAESVGWHQVSQIGVVPAGAGPFVLKDIIISSAPLPILAIPESQVINLIEDLAALGSVGGVTSVAGRGGAVVLAEADITSLASDLALKAPLASPTFTGTVTVPASTNLTDAVQKLEIVVEASRAAAAEATKAPLGAALTVVANSGAAQTLNYTNNRPWDVTLTADCTLTVTNLPNGCPQSLTLRQDGTGGRRIRFVGGTVTYAGVSVGQAASAVTVLTLVTDDNGGTVLITSGALKPGLDPACALGVLSVIEAGVLSQPDGATNLSPIPDRSGLGHTLIKTTTGPTYKINGMGSAGSTQLLNPPGAGPRSYLDFTGAGVTSGLTVAAQTTWTMVTACFCTGGNYRLQVTRQATGTGISFVPNTGGYPALEDVNATFHSVAGTIQTQQNIQPNVVTLVSDASIIKVRWNGVDRSGEFDSGAMVAPASITGYDLATNATGDIQVSGVALLGGTVDSASLLGIERWLGAGCGQVF